ncbi:MAG: succinate dehydrogenase cytochrome b558 subunit [Phycisphaerales bacterium]|nr:succinate dehydrogenase cytochrome b558 subunit [Phycisphaerales bacterium]
MPEDSAGFLRQHHFLLRRLHSLTGLVPVGIFLINHLLTNSTAFLGAQHFDEHVAWIHAMPWLLAIEIFGIFLPLAFHAGYGVVIALQGRPNTRQYPYMDNWRYTLQRLTAWITLVFIIVHLVHFRFAHWFGAADYKDAIPHFFTHTQAGFLDLWLPLWAWIVIYVIGLVAAVFHFCNGLVTLCITWGITVGDAARRKVGVGAAGLGVLLIVWGVLALIALARPAVAPQGSGGESPAPVATAAPAPDGA